jgi:hypothetical protein
MTQNEPSRTTFLGTYFDRSLVLRVARLSVILGWVILAVYVFDYLWSTYQNISGALLNGYPVDFMFLVISLRGPLQGLMLLLFLYAVSQALLILLDIEETPGGSAHGDDRREPPSAQRAQSEPKN